MTDRSILELVFRSALPRFLFPLTVIDRYRLACTWNVRREWTGFLPTLRNRHAFPVTQAMVGVRTRREWATPFLPFPRQASSAGPIAALVLDFFSRGTVRRHGLFLYHDRVRSFLWTGMTMMNTRNRMEWIRNGIPFPRHGLWMTARVGMMAVRMPAACPACRRG